MSLSFYPKSPKTLPSNLTQLPPSYKTKALLAIAGIILFFMLYAALVISLAFLVYYAVMYNIGSVNKFTILAKLGAIAGSGMLLLFTLKFAVKLKNPSAKNRLLLPKQKHPDLWAFVYKICEETGAPKPKAIFADPDVNAYVSYANMWLSLFLPVRKNLTVGLGLVDCLSLSEFKAVVSHEFGHFAQRSMKIGSYIVSANTIIHDMIYARDKWDDLLEEWRGSDLRLSAAAWLITPIIWLIRQLLELFYLFLNIMYSSLSREMEFNADKVAVSTSGSEAIVSALWKLDHGYEHWDSTLNFAFLAAKRQMFSKNLYLHNGQALKKSAGVLLERLNSLPVNKQGQKIYFSASGASKVHMYASHPPNDKREENAKMPFISCDQDERSPWILFGNKDELQEKMTALVHDQYLGKKPKKFVTSSQFKGFIRQESLDEELLSEYDNTFKNRFFHIAEEKELQQMVAEITLVDTKTLLAIKADLSKLMEPVKSIESLMVQAEQMAQGKASQASITYSGTTYNNHNLQEVYDKLTTDRNKIFDTDFKQWDDAFCAFHLALAERANKKSGLLRYYNQHKALTKMYRLLLSVKNEIMNKLSRLQTMDEVPQFEVTQFVNYINAALDELNQNLKNLGSIDFIPLPNIETVDELKILMVDGGAFKKVTGNLFENGGFNRTVNHLDLAISQCNRIDQKSIAGLLAFQKSLQKELSS